jgi:hypothetical protein
VGREDNAMRDGACIRAREALLMMVIRSLIGMLGRKKGEGLHLCILSKNNFLKNLSMLLRCISGCISGSIPVDISTRKCITSDLGCSGSRKKVKACQNPSNSCPKQFSNPKEYANEMCASYKSTSDNLDRKISASGLMVPFNKKFPDRVCMIHCLDNDGEPYAPYSEAGRLGLPNQVPFMLDEIFRLNA